MGWDPNYFLTRVFDGTVLRDPVMPVYSHHEYYCRRGPQFI